MQEQLNEKQLKFIDLYFKDADINTICKKLNITRQTYYNYINNELVKTEINNIRHQMLAETTNFLQQALKKCSKKLLDIIDDDKTSPQIKVNAINSIFNNCGKLTEQVDIIERLNYLEQQIEIQNKQNDI